MFQGILRRCTRVVHELVCEAASYVGKYVTKQFDFRAYHAEQLDMVVGGGCIQIVQ